MRNEKREKDCSKLRRGMDCLERNAKTKCRSCIRHERAEQIKNLQDDLNEHLDKLTDMELHEHGDYDTVENGVDVSDMFQRVLELRLGDDVDNWCDNMTGVRIPVLRSIANIASAFGMSQLAELVRKHIALRKGA